MGCCSSSKSVPVSVKSSKGTLLASRPAEGLSPGRSEGVKPKAEAEPVPREVDAFAKLAAEAGAEEPIGEPAEEPEPSAAEAPERLASEADAHTKLAAAEESKSSSRYVQAAADRDNNAADPEDEDDEEEEDAPASAAEEAHIKAALEELWRQEQRRKTAAAEAAAIARERLSDPGLGFFTRCSTCRALTTNRDSVSKKVYCRVCYTSRANESSSEKAKSAEQPVDESESGRDTRTTDAAKSPWELKTISEEPPVEIARSAEAPKLAEEPGTKDGSVLIYR